MKNRRDYYKSKVYDIHPYECEIIGQGAINNIIDSRLEQKNIEILESNDGSNLDFVSILTLVATTIQVIDFTIKIIEKKKKKNSEELREAVYSKMEELGLDSKENISYDKLIEELFQDNNLNEPLD